MTEFASHYGNLLIPESRSRKRARVSGNLHSGHEPSWGKYFPGGAPGGGISFVYTPGKGYFLYTVRALPHIMWTEAPHRGFRPASCAGGRDDGRGERVQKR